MNRSSLLFFPLWFLAAATPAGSGLDAEVLAQAHRYQLEFRAGNYEVVKPLVKSLEEAVARSPDNAQLWEAMGNAYMSQQGSMYGETLDIPALIATGEKAREAYARSLALNGDRPLVRAGLGMATMVVGQLKGDGPAVIAGIDEMNAAIRQAPNSTAVRLTRGFTIIHLPPAMRDTDAVVEDLEFILGTAPGGRPEDVLHVLLGDVYSEMGKLDAARDEYRQVSGASAFAAEQAKLRLEKGSVTPESIAAVRSGTGTRCAMCHAPGTDH